MGAALLKAGGMTTALVGGAFALFQANAAVEGSLAAAAVLQPAADPFADGTDDFGEDLGGSPEAATLDPGWFEDAPASPPPAQPPAPPTAADAAFGNELWANPPAAVGGAPLRGEPAAPAAATPARRIEVTPEPPAAEPARDPRPAPAAVDFDFDSWADPPAAAPASPPPADAFPAESEPAAATPSPVPRSSQSQSNLLEFDDRRPADAAVQLRVQKEAPPEAKPGESFVYTIVVKNVGDAVARAVSVEEPVPAGVTLEGTDPQADLLGQTLRWTLGDLPPGGERALNVKVVPNVAGTVGSVTAVRCDLTAAARTAVLAPRLALSAGPAGPVRAGRPFDLRITVSNVGTADAPAAAVRTVLPAGVTHVSGERDLVYDVGLLKAGQTREVSLTVAADAPGPVDFQCELTGAGAAPASTVAAVQVDRRQLTLTRSGPRTRFLGRTGEYKNVVTNVSQAPAPPVQVVETVPSGLKFASATAGGRFDAAARTVSWDVPALPPGRSTTLGVTLEAEAAGQLDSVVSLQTGGRTEAELVAATEVRGYTAVAPRIEGLNGPLAIGERVAVLVTLKNTGTDAASGLFADMNLPASMRALLYDGQGLEAEATDHGIRLTPTEPLAPGATVTAEVLVEGAAAGEGAIELIVNADHLPEPARRSEPVRVYADAE
ncbi:DUF11 domain-containing protein [Alienimonas californiensis]|uniref:Large cysteine-rich periplasmic protein omcB n=1 Tax=Alienimonas californiensis TaxID=2527989 RepID=A0A517PD90_9PLAN|nr:DUF11 domain-containing protein [Alienimonas californiensis]QDT17348.1 Large cysteine-rich periplasmic protein omcB precursor [Alienimonas californiensis]